MNDYGLKNDVVLCGVLRYSESKKLDSGKIMFKGRVNDIKIVAWNHIAERMSNEVKEGDVVRVSGIIKERKYEATCKKCGGTYNAFWTDVEVYAFSKESRNEK